MNWNEGCITNATHATAPGRSPAHLSFACLLNGFEPVPLDKPFTYFEFGFGQEPTVNRFAADIPHGHFYAADWNGRRAAAPQNAIADTGLSNLTLLENSFAELVQGATGLPQFDFIVMRGDYDRIPPESRRHVVDFIARHLKPGGIVYTNYNAMPGAATGHPLQRLVLEYEALRAKALGEPFLPARDFVQTLVDNGSDYFDSNPDLHVLWDGIKEQPVHCMNGMDPLYFADVAHDFAAAKLDFVGAADPRFAFPQHYLTTEQQDFLNTVADMVLRETLKDYIRNTTYRSDVFVRGARHMHPVRRKQWLERSGLALTETQNEAVLAPDAPTARIAALTALSTSVLDAFAGQPLTLAELAGLPALRDQNLATLLETAALLVAGGQATPFFANGAQVALPRHDRHSCENTEKRESNELE